MTESENKLKESLESFINSDRASMSIENMYAIETFNKILKGFGFNELELTGDEKNGWQADNSGI